MCKKELPSIGDPSSGYSGEEKLGEETVFSLNPLIVLFEFLTLSVYFLFLKIYKKINKMNQNLPSTSPLIFSAGSGNIIRQKASLLVFNKAFYL